MRCNPLDAERLRQVVLGARHADGVTPDAAVPLQGVAEGPGTVDAAVQDDSFAPEVVGQRLEHPRRG